MRAKHKLTDRQREILYLISSGMRRDGFPPTMRELCDACGIGSTNAIFKHLNALASKGYIKRKGNTARGITVLLSDESLAFGATNTSSRFVGSSAHRLEANPLEKHFADAWREKNEQQSCFDPCKTTLAYLLSKDGGKTLPETSDRDEMIAATIIQWLGSLVGSRFVSDVMERAGNDLAERMPFSP